MELYKHQREALEQTEGLNKVAYYHDMGLGKTFTGAEKMVRLGERVNLLICQKSKINDWYEHFFQNHMGEFLVFDLTSKVDMKAFLLSEDESPYERVGIINYELAWRRKDLLKLDIGTLMLDESSLIQNRKAKQTKFILKLQAQNVILLSGTPTAGKYENLWTQAHLLGWDISEALYKRQFVNWKTLRLTGGKYVQVVDKENPYKNVERLKNKFREHGAVFLKTEDCFDLPEQTFIEVNVSTSKEYKKFMKSSIVQVKGNCIATQFETELVGDTNLTKRLYARQLCGVYSKEKLQAFLDLLDSTNDRLIVFYNFSNEYMTMWEAMVDTGRNRPTSFINGNYKDLTCYNDFENSVTFVQYQAGAMGLNLQKANKVIYFSPPERCELFMQSQKRIHRIGQDRPCYYYKLICKGSVEEDIYKALERGEDFTDELFKNVE